MPRTLTTGSPWRVILAFSVPLLIGNVVQQLYQFVDAIVVGRLLGEPFTATSPAQVLRTTASSRLTSYRVSARRRTRRSATRSSSSRASSTSPTVGLP